MSQLKEDIREAFPNAMNIVDEGDGIRLTLPNGATVKVEFQDKISISPEQAAKAKREHGIRDEIDITVNGYTLIGAKKAFIALAQNGEEGTAFHEIFHIAYDMALTEKEKKAIERAFGEKAKAACKTVIKYTADKYRDWKLTNRRIPAALRRLFEAVRHIIDNIRKAIVDNDPEIHEIFKRIESGEVWGDKKAETGLDNLLEKFDNVEKVYMDNVSFKKEDMQKIFDKVSKSVKSLAKKIDNAADHSKLNEIRKDCVNVREEIILFNSENDANFKGYDAMRLRFALEVFENDERVIRARNRIEEGTSTNYQRAASIRNLPGNRDGLNASNGKRISRFEFASSGFRMSDNLSAI